MIKDVAGWQEDEVNILSGLPPEPPTMREVAEGPHVMRMMSTRWKLGIVPY